ncbi:hypothetical protein [Legionella gresilensis]|uniref:hypothetical protein n=1 Tax=Legionella gresilensis TaxID=91823 RepID=UPI00104100F7|nr:hypothetical protein [Legionella gresilensis]
MQTKPSIGSIKKLNKDMILLDLSQSKLINKTGSELEEIFSSISPNITALDLSWNFFYLRSSKELKKAFKTIPINITSLTLSWNNFAKQTGMEVADIFSALPKHINSLFINGACNKIENDLLLVLTSIPPSIKSLRLEKLEEGDLHKVSEKNLAEVKGSLAHIQTVQLNYIEVEKMSPRQRQLIKEMLPNIKKVILLDEQGNEILNSNSTIAARCKWELGDKKNYPSLLSWAAFYVAKNQTHEKIKTKLEDIPQEITDYINEIPKNFLS